MKTSSALEPSRAERRSLPFVLGALLAIVAVVGADFLSCLASLHYQHGDYYEYAKQYHEQCTIFRGPVSILILSWAVMLWGVVHSAHNEILAAASVGILIVTVALAHYTRRLWTETVQLGENAYVNAAQQARNTQKTLEYAKTSADAAALNAEIAQKSLYLLQRPYVVRSDTVDCGVDLFIHGKNDATIGCRFVNRGLTHAILVELYIDLTLVPTGELPPVIDPRIVYGEAHPPSRLIARDTPERFDVQMAKHVRLLDVRGAVMNGTAWLFLYGFMRYRDLFGKQYRHGFCGRYDVAKNDFVIDGGAEYNYSEDDSSDQMPPANLDVAASVPLSVLRKRPNYS